MNERPPSILEIRQRRGINDRIDPISELGEFAAKSDAQAKEFDAGERRRWGKMREEGIRFTEPVKLEAGMPPVFKGKPTDEGGRQELEAPLLFDWKITPADGGWTVADGVVYYLNDGTSTTVLSTTVAGETGIIYLHLTRDPSSRAVTAAVVEFQAAAVASTQTDQYIELGTVSTETGVRQTQFTPVRVFEDLFVVNGEFRYGSIAMFGDNVYELPAP